MRRKKGLVLWEEGMVCAKALRREDLAPLRKCIKLE